MIDKNKLHIDDFNRLSDTLNNTLNIVTRAVMGPVSDIIDKIVAILEDEWYSPCQLLADNQYVIWEFIDKKTARLLLDAKNINTFLRKINSKSNYAEIKMIANNCLDSRRLNEYRKLFSQSFNAFLAGNCELSILGFMSIIDGLLSDISNNPTPKIFIRADAILRKIEDNEDIELDDFSVFALLLTFRETMESFSHNVPFDMSQPKNINRHWIMHGRLRRRITKLDCIKMIRFIYGIILLSEFSSDETEEHFDT